MALAYSAKLSIFFLIFGSNPEDRQNQDMPRLFFVIAWPLMTSACTYHTYLSYSEEKIVRGFCLDSEAQRLTSMTMTDTQHEETGLEALGLIWTFISALATLMCCLAGTCCVSIFYYFGSGFVGGNVKLVCIGLIVALVSSFFLIEASIATCVYNLVFAWPLYLVYTITAAFGHGITLPLKMCTCALFGPQPISEYWFRYGFSFYGCPSSAPVVTTRFSDVLLSLLNYCGSIYIVRKWRRENEDDSLRDRVARDGRSAARSVHNAWESRPHDIESARAMAASLISHALENPFSGAVQKESFQGRVQEEAKELMRTFSGNTCKNAERKQADLLEALRRGHEDAASCINLKVSRQIVLSDALHQVSSTTLVNVLALNVHIVFEGEMGSDYGGVRRDFFTSLGRSVSELSEPISRDLFLYSGGGTLMPTPHRDAGRDDPIWQRIFAFGRLLGMAVFHHEVIPMPLSPVLFVMMTGGALNAGHVKAFFNRTTKKL